MDTGPFSTLNSGNKRVANRPEVAQASPPPRAEAPQAIATPRPRVQPAQSGFRRGMDEPKSKKPLFLLIIGVLVAIAVVVGVWFYATRPQPQAVTGIDDSKYQAVFLTNGQIYFGKLHTFNDEYLMLTDGYYPQAKSDQSAENKDKDASKDSGIQLIPMSKEVYGPENQIYVSKKQILHYENLRSDSQVARLISQNAKN